MERWDGNLAVIRVARVIAVGEPRRKFSQVALPDWLTARRTERLRAGCPAIHQDEFHTPPPRSVFRAWTRVASRQQRKLQIRSLQRKFIGEPPRWKIRTSRSPAKGAVNELVCRNPPSVRYPSPTARAHGGRPDQRPSVADRALSSVSSRWIRMRSLPGTSGLRSRTERTSGQQSAWPTREQR